MSAGATPVSPHALADAAVARRHQRAPLREGWRWLTLYRAETRVYRLAVRRETRVYLWSPRSCNRKSLGTIIVFVV